MNMRKGLLIIIFVFVILSIGVLAAQEVEPEVEFTEFECNDLGVLSFKIEYIWTGYKAGYVYLKSIEVKAIKEGKTIPLEGLWRKFKTEDFIQTEIKINSPTAYFFSKKDSLKEEGGYSIEIDYAVSKDNIERFRETAKKTVSCPKQMEVVKEVEPVPEIVEEEPEEEIKPVPKEPALFDGETKNYTIYYVIGLLVVIFIVSVALMKKLPRKSHPVKKSPSPKSMSKLFERKRV